MTGFYLFSALLISFALCMLLYPLLRRPDTLSRKITQLQADLAAVQALKVQGVLDESALEKSRRELGERCLNALESTNVAKKGALPLAVAFLALLPLSVMVLYNMVGTPRGMSFGPIAPAANASTPSGQSTGASTPTPNAQADATAAQGMDLNKAADGLRARLDADPTDGEGWQLLGRTYMELQQFDKAAEALTKALELLPKSADLYAQHGEALGLAARPGLPPAKAEESLDEALKLDPNHQNALWLKGVYRKVNGDPKQALRAWEALLVQLPEEGPMKAQLQQQIDILNQELGSSPATPPPAAAAATPAASETATATPATSKSVQVQIAITPELKAKLGDNDTLFVFARAASGPPMPLAVHRGPISELKAGETLSISLSDADAMMPTMTLSMFPQIVVGARISKSGVANAQSGDFQVLSATLQQPVSEVVQLTISEVVP